jgi:hypothetical protein
MLHFCRAGSRPAMTMLAVALLTTVAVSFHLRRAAPTLPLAIGQPALSHPRLPAERALNPSRQRLNPHSVRRAASPHLPRFPPLEVCVRRPPGARRATFMGPPSANLHMNGLMHCSKHLPHSITSSARISVAGSNRTPSSVAIFRFRTNSKCVGVSIGRSPGGTPRRIWTT